MAKKKKEQKGEEAVAQPKKKGKKELKIFLILIILLAALFLSTTVILFIGMMPMFVAFFVDPDKRKIRTLTVGAMNFAGCMPFLLELWGSDRSLEKAFDIIFDPMVIIIIYSAAAVGYVIDWAVTSVISNFLYQKGKARQVSIKKRQEELIKNWGPEVAGIVEVPKKEEDED